MSYSPIEEAFLKLLTSDKIDKNTVFTDKLAEEKEPLNKASFLKTVKSAWEPLNTDDKVAVGSSIIPAVFALYDTCAFETGQIEGKDYSEIKGDSLATLLDSILSCALLGDVGFVFTELLAVQHSVSTSFSAFKLILSTISLFPSLKEKTLNFLEIMGMISELVQIEGGLLIKKLNDELFDNKFADFDTDQHKRKLSKEEVKFLQNNFFILLTQVISQFSSDIPSISYSKHRVSFLDLVENEAKSIETAEKPHNLHNFYVLFSFICDILDIIYSSLHILDESFKESNSIQIHTNPFKNHKKKYIPLFFESFLEISTSTASKFSGNNIAKLIRFNMTVSEAATEANTVFKPFNQVGFSTLVWLQLKQTKLPLSLDKYYLFDTLLPLAAALMKRGQNFRYMGMEILFDSLSPVKEGKVSNLADFNSYSFSGVFSDLLEFLGGPDPQAKKTIVVAKLKEIFKIFTTEAKIELIKQVLTNSQEDKERAFIVGLVKEELSTDYSLLKEPFVAWLFSVLITDKIFVADYLETISAGVNLLIYLTVKDKNEKLGLNLYSLSNFKQTRANIKQIASLIEKWLDNSPSIKKDFLQENEQLYMRTKDVPTNMQKVDKGFDRKRNECLLCLNLIDSLESFLDREAKLIAN